MTRIRHFARTAAFPFIAAASLAGCATVAGTVGENYTTGLTGGQEEPGPGDTDGSGTAKITADATTNNVCFELTVQSISAPTAAHIHRGMRGEAGPVVLTLDAPTGGRSSGCLSVDRTLAAAIIAEPAAYYVNVHTADFPNGAVRGQLR